jgi:hypothetical protein
MWRVARFQAQNPGSEFGRFPVSLSPFAGLNTTNAGLDPTPPRIAQQVAARRRAKVNERIFRPLAIYRCLLLSMRVNKAPHGKANSAQQCQASLLVKF